MEELGQKNPTGKSFLTMSEEEKFSKMNGMLPKDREKYGNEVLSFGVNKSEIIKRLLLSDDATWDEIFLARLKEKDSI